MFKDGFSLNAEPEFNQAPRPFNSLRKFRNRLFLPCAASLRKDSYPQLDIMDPMTKTRHKRTDTGESAQAQAASSAAATSATIRKLASKELELDTLSDGEFSALCAAASPVILEALISDCD